MKKKINYGVVALEAVLILVVVFLVGFIIFHAAETSKIEKDLSIVLRNDYNQVFDELMCDVTFITPHKADVQATLFERTDRNYPTFVASYTLQATKEDGVWAITFTKTPIGQTITEEDY